MAKTYVITKRVFDEKDGTELHYPGQYVSPSEAQKHSTSVKLVETKNAVSEHSFDIVKEEKKEVPIPPKEEKKQKGVFGKK